MPIETVRCDNCGAEFHGVTAESAREKLRNHERDCSPTSDESKELDLHEETHDHATVSVNIKPPRQIEAYETTGHFRRMVQKRQEPNATKAQAQTVLRLGKIKSSHISDHYLFDYESSSGWEWRVVAKIEPEAFRVPQKKHKLVTIFALNSEQHSEVDKWT